MVRGEALPSYLGENDVRLKEQNIDPGENDVGHRGRASSARADRATGVRRAYKSGLSLPAAPGAAGGGGAGPFELKIESLILTRRGGCDANAPEYPRP